MCGIVGATSRRDITPVLVEGLRRLEYRGYDSAGVALVADNHIERVRVEGKVAGLSDALKSKQTKGHTGIAHTRWATHGKPCEANAHPHISSDAVALVHNGIIENHDELRSKLKDLGYDFCSETDTEVIAHLVYHHYENTRTLLQAVQAAADEMHGAFSLAVIHCEHPDELIAYRRGSPLVVGLGHGEHFVASDVLALRGFADQVIYLEEDESARISAAGIELFDAKGATFERTPVTLQEESYVVSKGKYRHFMQKEIFEQTRVLGDTLEGRIASLGVLRGSFGEDALNMFDNVKQIHIVACGTSYHAGLVAKYWLESLSGIPTMVEIASEYRYRDVVVQDNTLFITVSQSGETADTLAALNKAKTSGYLSTLGICNVPASELTRSSEHVCLTRAGVEVGVASTKAFTTQLAAFLMLAIALCKDETRAKEALEQLKTLPEACEQVLELDKEIKTLTPLFVNKEHALFLGRGCQYPIALEGALKLKEISYIHAEAYPAGELKHGPLALVDESMPVIAVAPNDQLLEKLKSNLHEVSARGGKLIVFVEESDAWREEGAHFVSLPHCGLWIAPIVYTLPLQMLSYHVSVEKGTDVDQPRNLAKSVTVE